MKLSKLFLISFIFILLSFTFVSAACTVTFDKDSYFLGETTEADMVCTGTTEKSKAYTLTWTNQTGVTVEVDVGTTPATAGEHFLESFTIPLDWTPGIWLNATLTGTNLEGNDSANVTSPTATDIIFTNTTITGRYLGINTAVKTTAQSASKDLSGGYCRISLWSNDGTEMLDSAETRMIGGEVKVNFHLDYDAFNEGIDYQTKIICYCGSDVGINECIDEEGTTIEDAIGIASAGFTTNTWMSINVFPLENVYENGTDYPNAVAFAGFGENIFYSANITNNNPGTLAMYNLPVLINNETGQTFTEPDEHSHTHIYSAPTGNNSYVIPFELSSEVPTGQYYITNYFDVFYSNILVTQGIVNTEVFNVTGTDDSFILENVLTDKSNYYTGEAVHVCINLTNNFDKRVEFEVLYNFRCGANNLDSDTDRSIVGEHSEFRALSGGSTQNQCADLFVNYEDHMLYKTSQCYASVTIMSPYIDTFDNKKSITSPVFNVTDYGMSPQYELNPSYPIVRVFPDWRRFDDIIDGVNRSYNRAKINITKLVEANLDPEGIITDNDWDVYVIFTEKMPSSQELYNYTVFNSSGDIVDNPTENKCLQFESHGEIISRCSIGIEEVNFSDTGDDYFEVRVWFEDLAERLTEATEVNSVKSNYISSVFNTEMIGSVSASSDLGLGVFRQNDCVTLHQICSNCTYVNVTSVKYPNGTLDFINLEMTKTGQDYEYDYCNTSALGNYMYNTCGDKDGRFICENLWFEITTTGKINGNTLPIFLLLGSLLIFSLAIWTKNLYFGFFAGATFIVAGIYLMIYGLGSIADMYTRVMAYISLGFGFILLIASAYEAIEDGGGDE